MSKKSLSGYCAYCGEQFLSLEEEHVVADCLLLARSKKVLVPSCTQCNRAKAMDDEHLRDMFANRVETAELAGLKPMAEKMERSAFREGRRSPGHHMLKSVRVNAVTSPAGDPIGEQHTMTVLSERVGSGLYWIVRGLYHHHTGWPLDPKLSYSYDIYNGLGEAENRRAYEETLGSLSLNQSGAVGDCLEYRFGIVECLPQYSNWVLWFYDRVCFNIQINEQSLIAAAKYRGLATDP